MESSACRRSASDADQSARACSATVKCEPVMVKEEPECGVSEAPVAEDLYAGHEIKDELVFGPELVLKQDTAFFDVPAITECQSDPKPAGGAGAKPESSNSCPGDGPRCNRSTEQQGAKRYLIKLKRLPVGDQHGSTPLSRDCKLNPSLVSPKLKPVHHGVGKSRAGEVITSCQPPPNDNSSTSGTYLPKHILTNTKKEPDRSNISFIPISHLSTIDISEKPYRCDVCNKWFTQKQSLDRHVRIHTGEKLYSCDVCNKRFTSKMNWYQHVRIHTGEKPFSCDVCNKRFGRKDHLATHVRTHTGEKPYSCDMCNKRFSQKIHLTQHAHTHTREKPYRSDVFNKRTHELALLKHFRTRTDGLAELKPTGGAGAKPRSSNSCPGDGPRCNRSTEQQGAKRYLIKLKRLPVGDQHGSTPLSQVNPSLVPPKLKPVHDGVGKKAGEVFTSCQPPPKDNLSQSHTYLPKRVLTNTNKEPDESKITFIQIS